MGNDKAKIKVEIIVDGKPKNELLLPDLTVLEVIKQLLPNKDPQEYQLSMKDKSLDPTLSLEENGVVDGSVLTLTKRDGGGGSYQTT